MHRITGIRLISRQQVCVCVSNKRLKFTASCIPHDIQLYVHPDITASSCTFAVAISLTEQANCPQVTDTSRMQCCQQPNKADCLPTRNGETAFYIQAGD